MNKIKTFIFNGCKNIYKPMCVSSLEKIKSYEIDLEINDFLEKNNYELIDIKINTIDTNYHNNGGFNDIDLIYTVIYKEKGE